MNYLLLPSQIYEAEAIITLTLQMRRPNEADELGAHKLIVYLNSQSTFSTALPAGWSYVANSHQGNRNGNDECHLQVKGVKSIGAFSTLSLHPPARCHRNLMVID